MPSPELCTTIVPKDVLRIGLSFGLTSMIAMYLFSHVSGGHFNPAITIALYIMRGMSMTEMLYYFLAQSLGAVAGGVGIGLFGFNAAWYIR